MAVEHRDLPDSGLHEPKGVANAPDNRVYKSDGAGSGTWSLVGADTLKGLINGSLPAGRILITDGDGGGIDTIPGISYGAMVITENANSFALTAAGDSTLKTSGDYVFFSGTGAPWTSENLEGITFGSNALTVPADGVYKVDFWMQIESWPNNSASLAVRYRINGGSFSSRYPIAKSNSNGDREIMHAFGLINLNAGDYLEMYIASTHTGNAIIRHANTTLQLIRAA